MLAAFLAAFAMGGELATAQPYAPYSPGPNSALPVGPPPTAYPSPAYPPHARPGPGQFPGAYPAASDAAWGLPPEPPAQPGGLFAPGQILATVGNQAILAGDLLPQVNEMLKSYEGQVPEQQLDEQRQALMRQLLEATITNKLLYLEFLRMAPPERVPEIENTLFEQFDKTELEETMKRAQVATPAELDAKLREVGSSLQKRRKAFAERLLAQEMVRRNVNYKPEITHDAMLAHYREHRSEYEFPEQVRWEHLMVRFDRFPDKAAAYRALADMGNRVLRGASLEEVARRQSQGPTAADGGVYDWTRRGSLVSTVLEDAVFSLPENQLSQILEDATGFHIVRVLERKQAGRVPFTEAQVDIKETLRKGVVDEQIKGYLEQVRAKTLVQNYMKDSPGGATAGQSSREAQPR
jgi:parvulin-like peptidyl-prolyl isomerase